MKIAIWAVIVFVANFVVAPHYIARRAPRRTRRGLRREG